MAKLTLMSEGYILKSLDDVNYYQGIADDLNDDFVHSAGAAGFEPEIYENYISEKEVKEISQTYIQNYFENKEATVDTKDMKVRLNEYLHDYVQKKNIKMEQGDEKRLAEYIHMNAQAYQKYLSFPFMQYLVMGFDMFDQVLPFVFIACLLIVFIAAFFLYKLKLKQKEVMFYISTICIASGLLVAGIPLVILIGKFVRRISLTPECYYLFMVRYFEGYLYNLLLCSGLLIVVGLLVMVIQKRNEHLKKS